MAKQRMAKIRETVSIALGALASGSLTSGDGPLMTDGGFITSTELGVNHQSRDADDPPVYFGIADKQLTDTEIEEALEVNGPTFKDQVPQVEHARRRVRMIGALIPLVASNALDVPAFAAKVETRMAWTEDTAGWKWWVYNRSGRAFTAGSTVDILATHNVRWDP